MSLSTEEVFDRHLQAFGAGDIDALMADYTEDSFVISPMGVFKGLASLRAFFEQILAEFAAPGVTFELKDKVIEGEMVQLTWAAETPTSIYSYGSDTFVIRDGKFVGQSVAMVVTPKA